MMFMILISLLQQLSRIKQLFVDEILTFEHTFAKRISCEICTPK